MKKIILGFVLGLMTATGLIGIVYALNASDIDYKETKVDQALTELYEKATDLPNFQPSVGWTLYNSTGWTAGSTATNNITLQTNKTYLVEILGGLNKSNTDLPTINTTFTNATCTLIDSKLDYNSVKAGNDYHFWYVKLYKCTPTSTTVTITQTTSSNSYGWFYTKAYEL